MRQHWRRTSMMPYRLPERLFSNFRFLRSKSLLPKTLKIAICNMA